MDQDINTFRERLHKIEKRDRKRNGTFRRITFGGAVKYLFGRFALLVLCAYMGLTLAKIVMVNEIGEQGFQTRIAELSGGDENAQIAARLLQRDPVMAFIESRI